MVRHDRGDRQVIDAARFPFNAVPPVVKIEGVWADGRLQPMGDEVRIPPSTTRVHLGFTAFELLYPESVRFRFRVEGLDAGWVDLGSNGAAPLELPPQID